MRYLQSLSSLRTIIDSIKKFNDLRNVARGGVNDYLCRTDYLFESVELPKIWTTSFLQSFDSSNLKF